MNNTSVFSDKLNKIGRLLFHKGSYLDAGEFFRQATLENPNDASSYAFLGTIHWQQGRIKEAVAYFESAIKLAADDKEINQMVADFLAANKNDGDVSRLQYVHVRTIQKPPQAMQTKKLLAVYDLSVQPYSIGDLLAFQAGTLVKCSQYGLDKVDFCFISDPNRIPLEPIFSKMMCENNHLYNLFTIIPILQLNSSISSIYILDSYQDLHYLLHEKQMQYEVWPSLPQIEANIYIYYEIIQLLDQYFCNYNCLPRLALPGALIEWYSRFITSNIAPMIPITVNLRNNPNFHVERNSNISAWIELFKYCSNRYPVKFIVVCSLSEVVHELRSCTNVVIAKDSYTSLENDLALIMLSAFHLGAASGPSTIPILSDKPYCILNCGNIINSLSLYGKSLIRISEQVAKFSFANELQRIILVPESLNILIYEFEKIWRSRDWIDWSPTSVSPGESQNSLIWLK